MRQTSSPCVGSASSINTRVSPPNCCSLQTNRPSVEIFELIEQKSRWWAARRSRCALSKLCWRVSPHADAERWECVKSLCCRDPSDWCRLSPPGRAELSETPCAMWRWRRAAGRASCTGRPPSMCRCWAPGAETTEPRCMSSPSITGAPWSSSGMYISLHD